MARHSTHVDMTAMCDVAFLLLTFFMLATKFKPDEPVVVQTPSSISSMTLPDTSIMLITVAPKDAQHTDDRIFFTIDKKNVATQDGKDSRKVLIDYMDEYKKLGLTEEEKQRFANGSSIGVPLNQLKSYLSAEPGAEKQMDAQATGIPADTTLSPTNELADWIQVARNSNPFLRICIKADGQTSYPGIHKVIATLGAMKIFQFNLITNLEGIPAGTAAYQNAQKEGK